MDFLIPEVGENIKQGTVVKINVSVGATVKKDQALLEMETDKASLEVPSPVDGIIKEILVKEGAVVKIGQLVMKIQEGASSSASAAPQTNKPAESKPHATVSTQPKPQVASAPSAVMAAPIRISASASARDVAAAPSVRRFAREIGVDVGQVRGTGPRGRVSMDDVKAHAKMLLTGMMPMAAAKAEVPLPNFEKFGAVERKPMNNIRKKTAEHLSHAWNSIPHVTQFDKADITELEKLRKQHKLTITPYLMKIMALALEKFPQFNASIDMNSSEIIYKKYIHLGVAVDTDRGLIVPVIRDVNKKSVTQISEEVMAAAERARNKKVSLEELQGGSMTLTNLGGIGGTMFTPIVNWPEVAILGISRGRMEPVYIENQFLPRMLLPLSLSYDHRLIDGADGARFIRWVAEAIEKPNNLE